MISSYYYNPSSISIVIVILLAILTTTVFANTNSNSNSNINVEVNKEIMTNAKNNNNNNNNNTSNSIKTIYLIRHAESEENRRIGSFKSSIKGLGSCRLPTKQDIMASMELLNVSAQLDSDVSPKGQQQIDQLGKRIAKDEFVHKSGIELVVHSPLKRARQTSHGMLQTVTKIINNDNDNTNDSSNNDSSAGGAKHKSVKRVIELELLTERTPLEWLPTHHGQYAQRIKDFEDWLSEQPEDVIAIVGHSQYFRSMLGLKSKFNNVDVWSLQFDSNHGNGGSSDGGSEGNEKKDDVVPIIAKDDKNDDNDTVMTTSIVTEFDGIPLEDLDIPRGWKQLKHHYRYDPNYDE
jgi:broad specificity phosphatase PhoE